MVGLRLAAKRACSSRLIGDRVSKELHTKLRDIITNYLPGGELSYVPGELSDEVKPRAVPIRGRLALSVLRSLDPKPAATINFAHSPAVSIIDTLISNLIKTRISGRDGRDLIEDLPAKAVVDVDGPGGYVHL